MSRRTLAFAKTSTGTRTFDVRPDRLDIRDREYRPPLRSLPPQFPDPDFIQKWFQHYETLVLDQGNEGACTGFGLAATINYIRFRIAVEKAVSGKGKLHVPVKASAAMLYRLARMYDEWRGEDYEGSSCRGAMKGWHKHGVCFESSWPHKPDGEGEVGESWRAEAAQIVLGAYYRVDVKNIADLQAAIHEVGAVYVSSEVHKGWGLKITDKVKKERPDGDLGSLPRIEWSPAVVADGVHSYALVGYNMEGFIVQNSWGPGWGWHSFALLAYEDWLKNGMDAWVAALGVPVPEHAVPEVMSAYSLTAQAARLNKGKAGRAGATAVNPETQLREMTLSLGNNGRALDQFVQGGNGAKAVERVMLTAIREKLKKSRLKKLVIYSHGGLNSEEASLNRARHLGPLLEENGLTPLFLTWHTGVLETLQNMGGDLVETWKDRLSSFLGAKRAGGILGDVKEKISETWDRTFENTNRWLLKAAWSEMKENAALGARDSNGGLVLTAAHLATLKAEFPDLEIHLVGHSAGTIIQGHLLTLLSSAGIKTASCHLYAAACTVGFANQHYAPAIDAGMLPARKFIHHMLSHENECADTVANFYYKSLLFLVSRGCEIEHKTPILGMQAAWDKSLANKKDLWNESLREKDVNPWLRWVAKSDMPTPNWISSREVPHRMSGSKAENEKAAHGSFDNNLNVINATLKSILGSAPPKPATNLTGF